MSGGGTSTQTIRETSDSAPWIGAQPALHDALGAARGEFQEGAPDYYGGDTVADFTADQQAGMAGIRANAGTTGALAGQGFSTLFDTMNPTATAGRSNVEGVAGGGTTNSFLDDIMSAGGRATDTSGLATFASGGNRNSRLDDILAAAGANANGGAASSFLTDIMQNGSGTNPHLDAMFDRGAGQIESAMRESFAKAGRGAGSMNFGDAFGENLSDFATDLYGGAYEADQNRRMGAAGSLFAGDMAGLDRLLSGTTAAAGLEDAGLGRQLTASGALSDFDAGDIERMLTASGMGADVWSDDMGRAIDSYFGLANSDRADRGLGLTAAGMMPGMYDFANAGAEDLLDIGGFQQGQNQAEINADVDRFNYGQNADRMNIEWLNAIASGQGQLGGTTASVGQQPIQRGSPLAGVGSALSGIAGLLSLFPSDRRIKTDIELLGEDEGGVRWYSYRNKGDAPGVGKHVGVMAQELAEIAPHLVKKGPGGLLLVDYGGLENWGR